MVDITVDDKSMTVEVDMRKFPVTTQAELTWLLKYTIDKVKYSDESISLWIAKGENKELVMDWP